MPTKTDEFARQVPPCKWGKQDSNPSFSDSKFSSLFWNTAYPLPGMANKYFTVQNRNSMHNISK